MGSNAEPSQHDEDEITVFVTGFGPFRAQHPINPSWEITNSLPPFLPPPRFKSSYPLTSRPSSPNLPPVRILIHPSPIHVSYTTVRSLVPSLWENPSRRIDYMLHIGMAAGRNYYSVERRAHRDGYGMRDVDGHHLGDAETRWRLSKDWVWDGCPPELVTDVDVDDVWRRWRGGTPGIDVRISEDAGRYLCDFIYYSSMAYLYKRDEARRVVFLHVPVDSDDTAIETGVEAALELIRAMVESDRTRKLRDVRDITNIGVVAEGI